MLKYGTTFTETLNQIADEQGITMEKPKLVKTFTYTDADGNKLYEKQRYEPARDGSKKEFFFKGKNGNGRGCESVMYNLPNIVNAKYIILVEGEGCADKLIKWGLPATSLDAGSQSVWLPEYTELLKGKKIVILPDNDEPGREYAERVAEQLKDVKIVELPVPAKGDIVDWKGTKEELLTIIKQTPLWEPKRDYVSVRSQVERVMNDMLYTDIDDIGVRTGIRAIDNMIGCLRRKTITVIGGRPSMGKTAFMLTIMLNMAKRGIPVMLFTPDADIDETIERLLCQIKDVCLQDVILRLDHDENILKVTRAAVALADMPIWIDETGGVQIEQMEKRLKTAIDEHGIKCVFIDYVQLMNTVTKTTTNEAAYIGHIARNLKRICKQYDIPIVMLSQLNRDCEGRVNKRPVSRDLKGSGAIEQEANGIMLLYRDEVYHPKTDDKGIAEVIITKFKKGKTGTAKVTFLAESMRFTDLYP
jgi:replicative DNA helicase